MIDSGEVSYNLEVTSKGTWLSADIPLSTFSNATLTEIKQIKTDAQSDANGGPGDVYFDNIYFWREVLTEPASAPAAPTADASNVISVFSDATQILQLRTLIRTGVKVQMLL